MLGRPVRYVCAESNIHTKSRGVFPVINTYAFASPVWDEVQKASSSESVMGEHSVLRTLTEVHRELMRSGSRLSWMNLPSVASRGMGMCIGIGVGMGMGKAEDHA